MPLTRVSMALMCFWWTLYISWFVMTWASWICTWLSSWSFRWAKICIFEAACALCVYQLDLTYVLWEFDVGVVQENGVDDEYNASMRSVGHFDDGATDTRIGGHLAFLTSYAYGWLSHGLGNMVMWWKWKLASYMMWFRQNWDFWTLFCKNSCASLDVGILTVM